MNIPSKGVLRQPDRVPIFRKLATLKIANRPCRPQAATGSEEFRRAFPLGLHHIALRSIRRMLKQQCHAQGFARLSQKVRDKLATDDLEAIEQICRVNPFIGGTKPASYDASVWAFLETIRHFPVANALTRKGEDSSALQAYLRRMGLLIWALSEVSTSSLFLTIHSLRRSHVLIRTAFR